MTGFRVTVSMIRAPSSVGPWQRTQPTPAWFSSVNSSTECSPRDSDWVSSARSWSGSRSGS